MSSLTPSMKWLLGAGAGVAGLALVGLLLREPDAVDAVDAVAEESGAQGLPSLEPPVTSRAETAALRDVDEAPRTSGYACGLAAGLRFGASYVARSSFEMGAGAGQASQRGKEQTVAGRLAFEVLEATKASAIVLVGFATERSASSDGEAEALSSPFLARVSDECEVTGYARHTATSQRTARLQQSLLHELWFKVPPRGEKVQVSFVNAVGKALGSVEHDAQGDLVRTIDLYREAWSPDMAGVRVDKSILRVHRGAHPWFTSVSGEQRLTVPSSQTSGVATLEVRATDYEEEALTTASRDAGDYVWEMLLGPLSRRISGVESIAQADRIAAMKDVTLEQAVSRFGTLVDTKAQQEEQHLIMGAFLDAHPEHISEYANALATHFPQEWKPPGYAALQVTQHPAAKEALLKLFREQRLHPLERVRSSLALAGRADVGVDLAHELADVARSKGPAIDHVSVSEHALMHLGVLAGLHSDDEEVLTITRETIEQELTSARTPEQLKSATLAVANTGDLTFLPILQSLSLHDDPDMREQVAIGMRRMPVDGVREFTLEWLQRERSFRVKREIFEVMQRQYHDADAKLDDALVAETVAHLDQRPRALTRQSIYRLLTPFARTHPDVRRALRESLVMEVEKDTGMAHYVMSILPQQDVNAALASIDTLADQFSSSTADPEPASPPPPSEPENPPPPDSLVTEFGNLDLPSEPEGDVVEAE